MDEHVLLAFRRRAMCRTQMSWRKEEVNQIVPEAKDRNINQAIREGLG